ncbi:MAG: thioredoxin family protein [Clostridia bacterium]|nr:thioredoxin family protein [Clostridia bacterium]
MDNLNFKGKVVIEFYGNGCLNCQIMSPIINNLEHMMPDVNFYRVNADEYPNLVHQYQIISIPSLLLFRDGKLLSRITGVKSQLSLQMLIEDTLNYA